MKFKFLVSLLLAAVSGNVLAQGGLKWTDNIYVNFGVGGMTVINDKLNSPTLNAHVQVGKIITPTWGVRAEVGGMWQSLEKQSAGYYDYCKKFGELNLDATLNLNSLFGNKNMSRAVNVYVFAGPTVNLSSAVSGQTTVHWNGYTMTTQGNNYVLTPNGRTISSTYESHGCKARIGATAGLGLGFRLTDKWALNLEGRYGVTPSIFGEGSDCMKAESTLRGTIGVTYVFGGLKQKKCCMMQKPEPVQATPEVKVVEKVVPKEVIKEVTKEVPGYSAAAIFFIINKAEISDEGMVNLKLVAETIKKNPSTKYKVTGYADKGTGSKERNQKLSEMRAEAVYNALIKEGVNADQLEKVAMGGVDPLFFDKANLTRVTVLESK